MVLGRVGSGKVGRAAGRTRLLRCALVALVLLAAAEVFAAPSLAADKTAEEILENMGRVFESAQSIMYKMQVSIVSPETGESMGFVTLIAMDTKSDILRMEILDTDAPMLKGQITVMDNKEKTVYIYMPMINQVMIQPMDSEGGSVGGMGASVAPIPAMPGAGFGITREYDPESLANVLRFLGTDTFQGRKCYVVEMKSTEEDEDGDGVVPINRFWVTADDYMLLKFEALDESGTLIMSTAVLEYRINPGFTRAQLLAFPKGVPVVDMRKK